MGINIKVLSVFEPWIRLVLVFYPDMTGMFVRSALSQHCHSSVAVSTVISVSIVTTVTVSSVDAMRTNNAVSTVTVNTVIAISPVKTVQL